MDTQTIYLDHNATTPVDPAVIDAMLPYLREHFGNPSSSHASGRAARAGVDEARQQVAALLGADASEIVFTSGGTESNNLAIRGVCSANPRGRHVVSTIVEHPAVREPINALLAEGWTADTVGVDSSGRVDAEDLLRRVRADTTLITVMHANNEVGTLQPIASIAAGSGDVPVHTDAAQSIGKLPVDVNALGVDLLTIAGHKLYAPKGVGALYIRRGTPLSPFARGAGHEGGIRPGTENVASIVGLGEACRLARVGLEAERVRVETLRDRFWVLLQEGVPGVLLNGHASQRLPNTLNVRFPDTLGSAVLAGAEIVAASTGSACHEHGETASAVLLAMGIPSSQALGAVRLSLGHSTKAIDVERAAAALVQSWRRLR